MHNGKSAAFIYVFICTRFHMEWLLPLVSNGIQRSQSPSDIKANYINLAVITTTTTTCSHNNNTENSHCAYKTIQNKNLNLINCLNVRSKFLSSLLYFFLARRPLVRLQPQKLRGNEMSLAEWSSHKSHQCMIYSGQPL